MFPKLEFSQLLSLDGKRVANSVLNMSFSETVEAVLVVITDEKWAGDAIFEALGIIFLKYPGH